MTHQFKHVAGFGVDAAKCPIGKSLQPRPVTLQEVKYQTEEILQIYFVRLKGKNDRDVFAPCT